MTAKPQSSVKSHMACQSTRDIKGTETFSGHSNWCIFAKLKMYKIFQYKDQVKTSSVVLVAKTKRSPTREIWTRLLFCGVSVYKDQLVWT